MGSIRDPRAFYGLVATGIPSKTQVANDQQIGKTTQTIELTGATKAYCVSATLASSGDTLTIDLATGIATGSTTPVAQVETATVVAAAGATSNGNLAVTVTAARVTGSPLSIPVALTTATHTTASLIAGAIRTAFNANAALTAVYTVGGSGADVTLTETIAENNDSTLNIAITAGLGVSAVASSTNTTAGVGGVQLTNNTGDGKDFEGVSLGTMSGGVYAFLIRNTSASRVISVESTDGTFKTGVIAPTGFALVVMSPDELVIESTIGTGTASVEATFTAS